MPQRFLRPGIRTSDAWNSVSFGAQSLYIRLLTLVDDFGRYDGRIPVLHGECFALRSDVKPQQTAAFRCELQLAHLIDVYSIEGKEYVQVSKWQERARTDKSKYPDPQDSAAERCVPQEKDASLAIASTSSPVHHRQRTNGLTSKPPVAPVEDLIADLEKDETYRGINVRREYGKMLNWCKARKNTPTRRRFINWLNKVDAPLGASARMSKPKADPRTTELPNQFKVWAIETFEERRDEIAEWKVWGDVPDKMRNDWWGEEQSKLFEKASGV